MTDVTVEVRGMEKVQAKMEQIVSDLQGGAFLQGMRDATLLVERHAKINAPVDTGRLRASITPEVRQQSNTVQGVVGSNVVYAPFQELGWTTAKGTKVPGKKYLERALKDNANRIFDLLGRVVNKIVVK